MTDDITTGDIRERLAVLETLMRAMLDTQRESARERVVQFDRIELDRKVEAESVKQALASAADKNDKAMTGIGTRLTKVESDLGEIKMTWSILVKAGAIGGAIVGSVVSFVVWIAMKFGWLPR